MRKCYEKTEVMKKTLLKSALAIVMAVMTGMHVDAQAPHRDVDSLLRAVRERDQKLRLDLMDYYARGMVDSVLWCSEEMERADAENQRTVFGILDAGGWPEGLSHEASSAIFLVIDHADVGAQKRYYRHVVRAARRGDVERSSPVTLRDRILMHEGKRQIYGTQTVSFARGDSPACYVWPVVRPRSLDRRRSRVNLPAMAEYVGMVGEGFGFDVVWDRSLSVGDLDRMRKDGGAAAESESED